MDSCGNTATTGCELVQLLGRRGGIAHFYAQVGVAAAPARAGHGHLLRGVDRPVGQRSEIGHAPFARPPQQRHHRLIETAGGRRAWCAEQTAGEVCWPVPKRREEMREGQKVRTGPHAVHPARASHFVRVSVVEEKSGRRCIGLQREQGCLWS